MVLKGMWRKMEKRILKFSVINQTIKKDNKSDFSGIAMGTSGYLIAQFDFSKEWNKLFKVAEFRKRNSDKYYPAKIVNNQCEVPKEVTDTIQWTVKVVGKNGDTVLTTNTCAVMQEV